MIGLIEGSLRDHDHDHADDSQFRYHIERANELINTKTRIIKCVSSS